MWSTIYRGDAEHLTKLSKCVFYLTSMLDAPFFCSINGWSHLHIAKASKGILVAYKCYVPMCADVRSVIYKPSGRSIWFKRVVFGIRWRPLVSFSLCSCVAAHLCSCTFGAATCSPLGTPAIAANAAPLNLGAHGLTLTALHAGAALRGYFPTAFAMCSVLNVSVLRRTLCGLWMPASHASGSGFL